ncbi:hypothetical protein EPO04_02625 [Patescibacteria group bacterium]|nr:MAG: hypothetical protein EPO04_02625 [Patescibacteria group bacterium]
MKLTPKISNEIVSRAQLVLGRRILVTDQQGRLMAGNTAGLPVKGAILDGLRACQEGKVIRGSVGETSVSWCPFVYEQQTIGAFGVIEEDVQVTPEALSLLQGLTEVVTHQHFLLERVQPSGGVQAKFLRELLTSTQIDTNERYRQADILQLNIRAPQAVMLVRVGGLEPTSKNGDSNQTDELTPNGQIAEIITTIQALFDDEPDNVVAYLGDEVFVVLKGIGGSGLNTRNTTRFLKDKGAYLHRSLAQKLPSNRVTIGVGQYYPDLGGLRKSYQESKLALSVGSRVWGEGQLYHIRQVGMFVTLANTAYEHKAELAHQILHPLLRDEQLYKTVRLFLENGLNLTNAAQKLHVHRNTLIYRLDKVSRLIGLDPRKFEDALQIKLGLMFYQDSELPATNSSN